MTRNAWRYAAVAVGFVASAPALARALRWAYTGESPLPEGSQTARSSTIRHTRDWHQRELTRLSGLVQQARTGESAGRSRRVLAATAAYDGALLDSCRAAGVPLPDEGVPLTDTTRLDVETGLVAAGMSW